ncbi:MAG TPA: S8 family serine peptidase [Chloroflexia bacterium]|nr:S8 family serine peptidase [Chloroflexia bacterium]
MLYKFIAAIVCAVLLALPVSSSYSQDYLPASNSARPGPQNLPTEPEHKPSGELKLRFATFDPLVKTPVGPSDFNPKVAATSQDGLYIVQLKGPVLQEWRESLTATGAAFYQYLPDFAFLAKLTASQLKAINALPFVRWVGPFYAYYKLDPALLAKNGKLELEVVAAGDEPASAVASAITNAGGAVKAGPKTTRATPTARQPGALRSLQSLKVEIDRKDLPRLAALDSVVALTERPVVTPDNNTAAWISQSSQPNQYPIWSMDLTGAGPAPSSGGTPGSEQIIAIADTGVYLQHQDFQGPAYPNATILGLTNWGALSGSAESSGSDSRGHGTHVAGTLAGSGAASGGETPYNNGSYKGIAFGSRLYVQQLGYNLDYLNDPNVVDPIGNLMSEARSKGARLQNNSWSAPDYGAYDAYSYEADNYMWNNPDVLGVWAAGNFNNTNGLTSKTVGAPGTAKNILAVGASENTSTNIDTLASFSGRGPTQDGRAKPDVIAPGECLTSVQSGTTSGYICMSGTSMATPVVTGSAALVRDWFANRLNYTNPQAALVKATLINSTDYMAAVGGNLPDPNQGWGRIDLANVINNNPSGFVYADNTTGLQTNEDAYYVYQVADSNKPLKITLAWTDPPGSTNATSELVNNLDLVVTAPDNTRYLGNNFNGQYSQPGGAGDSVNNVEGVTVQNPSAGLWKVRVYAYNVPSGPQPFAIAAQADFNCNIPAGYVTNTTDNSVASCGSSLRQALQSSPAGQTINLTQLPSGATIYPQTPLPALKQDSTLTGNCNSVYAGKPGQPAVRLNGKYLASSYPQADGLALTSGNTVQGVATGNFPGNGFTINGTNINLTCTWSGTLNGINPAPNNQGVEVLAGSDSITFGNSSDVLKGNIISGNRQAGFKISGGGPNILFYNNYIGYKADGSTGLKNGGNGLKVAQGAAIKLRQGNKISSR